MYVSVVCGEYKCLPSLPSAEMTDFEVVNKGGERKEGEERTQGGAA